MRIPPLDPAEVDQDEKIVLSEDIEPAVLHACHMINLMNIERLLIWVYLRLFEGSHGVFRVADGWLDSNEVSQDEKRVLGEDNWLVVLHASHTIDNLGNKEIWVYLCMSGSSDGVPQGCR